jgi:hypothetical protein
MMFPELWHLGISTSLPSRLREGEGGGCSLRKSPHLTSPRKRGEGLWIAALALLARNDASTSLQVTS